MSETLNRQVSASTDDCRICQSSNEIILDIKYAVAGDYSSSIYDYESGFRFQNITIPQGAEIISAKISIYGYDLLYGSIVYSRIYGEDSDNANTFSTFYDYNNRNLTSEYVNWTITSFGTSWHDSPDITDIIQEIINRSGWESGNSLVLFWKEQSSGWGGNKALAYGRSYDYSTSLAAKLEIEYSTTVNYTETYTESLSLTEKFIHTTYQRLKEILSLSAEEVFEIVFPINWEEKFEAVKASPRTFFESFSLTDSIIYYEQYLKILTESIALSPVFKKLLTQCRELSNSITLSDTFTKLLTWYRERTETTKLLPPLLMGGAFEGKEDLLLYSKARSWGIYNIEELENPGRTPYVLRQRTGEYEMYGNVLEPNTNYVMSCWVGYTDDWDGNTQIFHTRYWSSSGNPTTGGNGTLIKTKEVGGIIWEYRYLSFKTNESPTGYLSWYLGYSAGGTTGWRYLTNIKLEKGTYPTLDYMTKLWSIKREKNEKIGLVPPDDSCVLRYDFNENQGNIAKDTSGQLNDGNIVDASWVNGKRGKALKFNVYGHCLLTTPINSPKAVSFWHKRETWNEGNWHTLLCRIGGSKHYALYHSNDNLLGIYDSGFYSFGYTVLADGLWHHYYIEYYSGTNAKLWVDKIYKGQTGHLFNTSTYPLGIIGNYDVGRNQSPGAMDEIYVYNRVLNAYELEKIYEEGEPTYLEKEWSIYREYLNVLSLSDTIQKISTKIRAETLNLSDTFKKVWESFRIKTESISLTDTFKKIWQIYKEHTENTSLSDAFAKTLDWYREYYEKTGLVPPDDSVVLRLDFDEGRGNIAKDTSGLGNDGTIYEALWVVGKFGKGLSHDGNNDYTYAPVGSWLGENNHPWTVEAWFNSPSDGGPIIGITNTPPGGGWNMPFLSLNSSGYLYGYAWGGGQVSYYVGFDSWIHGLVTYSPDTGVTLYVDGVNVGNDPNPNYNASGAFNYWTTYIPGAKPSGVPSYLKGIIDEVRVYDRALEPWEIKKIYEEGEPKYLSKIWSIFREKKQSLSLSDLLLKNQIKQLIESLYLGVPDNFEYIFPFRFKGNAVLELLKIYTRNLMETITLSDSFTKLLTWYKELLDKTYIGKQNLIKYSQDFSNGTWGGYCGTKNNITQNTTEVKDPLGGYTATKIVTPATISCGSSTSWGCLQTASPAIGLKPYTISIWARGKSGGEQFRFGINDHHMTLETLTTSWVRYSHTFYNKYPGNRGLQFFVRTANQTYYVWGAQLEEGTYTDIYRITTSTPYLIGNSLTKIWKIYREKTESISISDTLEQLKVWYRELTDSITLTDSIIKYVSFNILNSLSLTVNLEKIWKIYREKTEAVSLSDVLETLEVWYKEFVESISLTDSIIKDLTKLYNETLTLSDNLIKDITRKYTDSISLSDSIFKSVSRILIDTIVLGFAGQFTYFFPFYFYKNEIMLKEWKIYREKIDSLSLSDNIWYTTYQDLIEALSVDDFIESLKGQYKIYTETLNISDVVSLGTKYTFNELILLGRSEEFTYFFPFWFQGNAVFQKLWHIYRLPEETVTLSDIVERGVKFYKFLIDTILLIDLAVLKDALHIISGTLNLTDSIHRTKMRIEVLMETLKLNIKMYHNLVFIPSVGRDLNIWFWLDNETISSKKLIGSLESVALTVDMNNERYKEAQKRITNIISKRRTINATLQNFTANETFQNEILDKITSSDAVKRTFNILIRTTNMGATKTIRLSKAKINSIEENIGIEKVKLTVELEAEEIDDV